MLRKPLVVLVVCLSFAALDVARAFAHDDAGSGEDAGDSKNDPLFLARYGPYEGDLYSGSDGDWYAKADHRKAPVCVAATFQPDADVDSTLRLTTLKGTRTLTIAAPGGSTQRIAIAAQSLYLSRPGLTDGPSGPTHYGFSLAAFSLPTRESGDAGTGIDAGSRAATALPASNDCTPGNLVATLAGPDVDLYAVVVAPESTLYYSIASIASDVKATLVDATGELLGPTVLPGELAGVYLPEGGTYYVSASSSSAIDTSYLMGLAVDGPGSPCRPNCIVLE